MLHDQEIQTDESDSERQIVKQLNERIKFSFVTGLLILGQLSHHHNDPMTLQRHNVITLSPSDPGNALQTESNPQVTKQSVCLKLLRGVLTTIIVK